jgi:hypothetical protein
MKSGNAPTRQVPVVQPLWVIETSEDGVGTCTAPPSDNPDKKRGALLSHQCKQTSTYGT